MGLMAVCSLWAAAMAYLMYTSSSLKLPYHTRYCTLILTPFLPPFSLFFKVELTVAQPIVLLIKHTLVSASMKSGKVPD